MRTKIIGTGSYLPEKIVTNADLEKLMDTTDEWITQRSGIKERRMAAENESTCDLAFNAAKIALERAKLDPKDIDLIIVGTLSPDYFFPGTSCLLQTMLGLENTPTLDLRNQCSAFVYGLSIADQFIKNGMYKNILLVGSEVQTPALNMSTAGRDTAVLFGDGAGAVVLTQTQNENEGILSSSLGANGKYANELCMKIGGLKFRPLWDQKYFSEGYQYPYMNGKRVFVEAVRQMPASVQDALNKASLKMSDINYLIPHQANIRIIEAMSEFMRIPLDRIATNIDKYGNTTAASIPIALDEALTSGKIKKGDIVVLTAFGAGFTWGSNVIRWS